MRKNKKVAALVLVIAFVFNLFPTIRAEAANDLNIISNTVITVSEAKAWAKSKGATDTFVNLADIYWRLASQHGGVNPAVAYIQSAKETGYGKFGGVINESYKNPCGMKTSAGGDDYDPNAHQKFSTWEDGVQAHLDHLALYAGASGYPRSTTTDPRHFPSIKGKAETVIALGGNWAPSSSYGKEILNLYNELENSSVSTKMHGNINDLSSGSVVTGGNLLLRGWALNPSGIKEVKVFIDEDYIGSAKIGISRPDIKDQYPNYQGSDKSGYELNINLNTISAGSKNIRVEQIGNDGTKNIINRNVIVNKLETLGRIDEPNGISVTGNTVKIRGWAIAESGIKEVKVFIDGKYKGTTYTDKSREDVKKVYPQYPNSEKSGYEITVGLSDISGGTKIVRADYVANDGSVKSVESTIKVSKLETVGRIDSPRGNTVSGDRVEIEGWALASSGVKEVKIFIDGKYKGTTNPTITRTDVKNAFPQYSNAEKSGYKLTVGVADLAGGNRTIVAEVIANDGTTEKFESTFNIAKLETVGRIDSPRGNTVSGDRVEIEGWALASSGVKEVKIFIDGKYKGTTNPTITRTDVKNAFPQYSNAEKSGYKLTVGVADLAGGNRTIVAEVIANDGTTEKFESTFNIAKLETVGRIDSPRGNTVSGDRVEIEGWALASSGVKEVKIFIDGKYKGTTSPTITRTDVKNAFPQYSNAEKSGYKLTTGITDLAGGNRTIVAEVIANDGTTEKFESTFNIAKLETVGRIDSPRGNTVSGDRVEIEGWALASSGVKEVKIFIDGKYKGTTSPTITRTDVKNAFPQYSNAEKSGYKLTTGITDIAAGNREVIAEVIANDNTVKRFYSNIKIEKKIALDCIDTPVDNYIENSNTLNVKGWALNDSGVKEIKVYLDNTYKTNATLGISRDDVNKAHPGYPNGANSGFEVKLNLEGLSKGKHELKIQVIGQDGTISNRTRSFYYQEGSRVIVLDAGHGGKDPGSSAVHFEESFIEKLLNLEVALKTKSALEAKGNTVIMTRTGDEFLELSDIAKRANESNVDLFISIHQNSFSSPSANGTEVYYTTNYQDAGFPAQDRENKMLKSKELAISVVNKIASRTGFYNRGAKDANFHVLRNTSMPAVLVECGFLSNPTEAKKLKDSETQQKIATSIADGVEDIF